MTSGKGAVLVIVGLGLAMASYALWFRADVQGPAVTAWGRPAVVQILQSPQVEAIRLEPEDPTASMPVDEILSIDGRRWYVAERRDVSQSSGIGYVRTALTIDRSFGGGDEPETGANWLYALRFGGEQSPLTLVFAPNVGRALILETGARAAIAPAMAPIEQILQEWFATAAGEK